MTTSFVVIVDVFMFYVKGANCDYVTFCRSRCFKDVARTRQAKPTNDDQRTGTTPDETNERENAGRNTRYNTERGQKMYFKTLGVLKQ